MKNDSTLSAAARPASRFAALCCVVFYVAALRPAPIRGESARPDQRGASPGLVRKDLFSSGVGGYHTYRIPSLVISPRGTLLVFCEGRKSSRSDDGDIDMLLRRSPDLGKTWLPVQMVHEEGGDAAIKFGNPCPVVDRETGVIWLTMNRSVGSSRAERSGGDILLASSTDEGRTWSAPRDVTDQVKQPHWKHYAQGPGIGIQIERGPHAGRLIVPANYRESYNNRDPSFSHVMYSDDYGGSWRLGGVVGPHTNECQVAEIHEQGQPGLLINMRNHWARAGLPERAGRRLVARSLDGGLSWSEPEPDWALVEPTCQASLLRYSWPSADERGRILFANPAGSARSRLTVRASFDEGRTWPRQRVLEEGSAAYCCLARLPDGRVGIVYERDDYRRLTFAAFPLAWLESSTTAVRP